MGLLSECNVVLNNHPHRGPDRVAWSVRVSPPRHTAGPKNRSPSSQCSAQAPSLHRTRTRSVQCSRSRRSINGIGMSADASARPSRLMPGIEIGLQDPRRGVARGRSDRRPLWSSRGLPRRAHEIRRQESRRRRPLDKDPAQVLQRVARRRSIAMHASFIHQFQRELRARSHDPDRRRGSDYSSVTCIAHSYRELELREKAIRGNPLATDETRIEHGSNKTL